MSKDTISYQVLYELVDKRTSEIMIKIDGIDGRVKIVESWKDGLKAQLALILGVMSLVFTVVWDGIRRKLNW